MNGIEHGSTRDMIPEALLARMKQSGVTYDPTLAVFEAIIATAQGKTDLLDRTLVQQVGPPSLLQGTRKMFSSPERQTARIPASGPRYRPAQSGGGATRGCHAGRRYGFG